MPENQIPPEKQGEKKPLFPLVPLKPEQHPITSLSKIATDLPFFYLTKKKDLLSKPVNYRGVDFAGRPIRWSVQPNISPNIGVPGIEAHEIWIRLIKPAIDDHRDPDGNLPRIVPLGKLRECLRITGWVEGGWQARNLLKAIRQIGAAWCKADLWIPTPDRGPDGDLLFRSLKGEFNRISLYAIGDTHLTQEELQNGAFTFNFDLEDTIYVELHSMEMQLQRTEPQRRIDNQYLFSVSPAARRWYELVAPKIFGVIKNNGDYCEIRYSWYVQHHHTLKRYYERKRVVWQMNRVVEDQLASQYLAAVKYRAVKEADQQLDFIIRYYPGPGAKQSVQRTLSALSQQRKPAVQLPMYADERPTPEHDYEAEKPKPPRRNPAASKVDPSLLNQFTSRGIPEDRAVKLIANLAEGQHVMDQLEYGDWSIQQGRIKNPVGFYIHLIKENFCPPATFESSRVRKLREEAQRTHDLKVQEHARLNLAYEEYRRAESDRYIEVNYTSEELEELMERKRRDLGPKWNMSRWRPEHTIQILKAAVRSDIEKQIPFTSFEAFCEQERKRPHQMDLLREEGSTPPLQSKPTNTKGGTAESALPAPDTSNNFTV